jgi:hypothetical protein
MQFSSAKEGWLVTFVEENLNTSLPRRFVFQNDVKILDLVGAEELSSTLPGVKRSSKESPWAEGLSGSA